VAEGLITQDFWIKNIPAGAKKTTQPQMGRGGVTNRWTKRWSAEVRSRNRPGEIPKSERRGSKKGPEAVSVTESGEKQ